MDCFLDFQDIKESSENMQKHVVECLASKHDAHLESANADNL